MKLHHLRSATLIIETGNKFILVDPMLGNTGSGMPYTLFRFKPRKNPLLPMPLNGEELLSKVTHCLITHLHPDHLDETGIEFLKERNIPVICGTGSEKALKKKGLNVTMILEPWIFQEFLGGKICGVPARHGYGFVASLMGYVSGFYLQLPGEKSAYIAGDTVYTENTDKVLNELKPDVSVLACGSAQMDFGQPLLMSLEDILKFVERTPGKVFANHMDALNHCPTTRQILNNSLAGKGLSAKVAIPKEGETVEY